MCGIIGEIADDPIELSRFIDMRDELSHRGPDGADYFLSDDETTALGFRRLAIIDLSDDGMQPMANEDGTVWLVFNGEIYNFRLLRDQLRNRGHAFQSETDSEVILHGYEEWGTDILQKLEGMFAFAIWDDPAEELLLARDPFGIKPLYYYESDERFVFASEVKAIVADERVPREISTDALHSYLTYRYIPAPQSIWKGVAKLPPGHYLVTSPEGTNVRPYWQASDYLGTESPDEKSVVSELSRRLQNSVDKHLVSDVPVGVLLSGGVDSGIVTAIAANANPDLTAFSLGFEDTEDELVYARRVVENYGLSHIEEALSSADLDDLLEEILYYYDEPIADSSIFPTLLLMKAVSQHLKVVLSGDGGDELFAGYSWYDRYINFKKFNRFAPFIRILHKPIARLNAAVGSSLVQSLEWRLELASLQGLDQYQTGMHPPIPGRWRRHILTDEYCGTEISDPVSKYSSGSMDIKELQYLDLNSFLPADVLAKVDRASMANSLEVRVPILDRSIAEYSLSLDSDIVFPEGEKKHLLRSVGRSMLPDGVIDRPKSGFGAPIDEFGFIDEYRDVLSDSTAARDGIFDQAGLERYLRSNPRPSNVFKLLLFELWYRKWATPS